MIGNRPFEAASFSRGTKFVFPRNKMPASPVIKGNDLRFCEDSEMTEAAYVQAFDLMWEMFPEPTLLVHKDRTVLAANASARQFGRREGEKCFGAAPTGGGNGHCRSCKADQALQERKAISAITLELGGPVTSYWLPLPDAPDLYVHFGVGVADLLRKQGTGFSADEEGQDHVS
jgi:hypothetical protein